MWRCTAAVKFREEVVVWRPSEEDVARRREIIDKLREECNESNSSEEEVAESDRS